MWKLLIGLGIILMACSADPIPAPIPTPIPVPVAPPTAGDLLELGNLKTDCDDFRQNISPSLLEIDAYGYLCSCIEPEISYGGRLTVESLMACD